MDRFTLHFTYILLFLSLLVITSCGSTSKKLTHTSKTKVSYSDKDKSLLWEISGQNLTKPSYLFGTIHAIGSNDFFISEVMRSTLKKSDKLILEIDLDDKNHIVQAMLLSLMKNGDSIKKLLSEEDYKIANTFFTDSLGQNLNLLDKVKPILLSSFLIAKYVNGEMQSYETKLIEMVKVDNKEVLGLETIQDQMNAIDKIPYEEQTQMLMSSINEFEEGRVLFREMVRLYKEQDIYGLFDLMRESADDINTFSAFLISQRNKNWIPKIKKMSSEQSNFFAVGAGHLAGEEGLITLLKNEGFTLKALK